jgi:hypothetical protein
MAREKNGKLIAEIQAIISPEIESIAEQDLPFQYDRIAKVIQQVVLGLEDPSNKTSSIEQLAGPIEQLAGSASNLIGNAGSLLKNKNYPNMSIEDKQQVIKDELINHLKQSAKEYSDKAEEIVLISKDSKVLNKLIEDKLESAKGEITSQFNSEVQRQKALGSQKDVAELSDDARAELLEARKKQYADNLREEYQLAVRIFEEQDPEKSKEIIAAYQQKQQDQLSKSSQKERELREELLKGKEKSVNDYLVVTEGYLTSDQASSFSYQQLNTYGAYSAQSNNVKALFKIAREYYPNDPNKGLQELAEIPSEKISDILHNKFIYAFERKIITMNDFNQLNKEQLDSIKDLDHPYKIELIGKYGFEPADVKDAKCLGGYPIDLKSIECIRKAYGPNKSKAKAKEVFDKIKDLDSPYKIELVLEHGIDPGKIKDLNRPSEKVGAFGGHRLIYKQFC